MNDKEEVVTSKMESVSVVKEEQHVQDINDGDSFVAKSEDSTIRQPKSSETNLTYTPLLVTNCDIIVLRTLQQQRNNYLDELTLEGRMLVDFVFYSEYEDVSRLSIDQYDPIKRGRKAKKSLKVLVQPTSICKHLISLLTLTNYINWLIKERKRKERFNSIIDEREIDLEKAKDNPKYDTMKAKWLKEKEKMIVRERQLMSSWEKLFLNNSIRDADLILVLTHLDNHFTVLVFNVHKKLIEDIDNRSDNKHFKRYGEEPYDRVSELVIELIAVVLMVFTIGKGLFLFLGEVIRISMIMVSIVLKLSNGDGGNEKMEPISTLSTQIRRDKEKHLLALRAKRIEKVFEEDQKIREERARHEKEVDDFLNDNLDDSAKLEAFLQYDYNQDTKPQ
ncbi:Ferrichrome outer membrane transporter/phage receptor [Bienertia sinuspersici]